MMDKKLQGYVCFAFYIACIPLANWLIGHVGTFCVPDGPCMIPVWPGIAAPSGVLAIGAALVLRDLVQRRLGLAFSLAAIVIGALISWAISPTALVVASVAAFVFSETADALVFTPLQKRGLLLAVVVSSTGWYSGRQCFVLTSGFPQLGIFVRPDYWQALGGVGRHADHSIHPLV